MRACYNTDKWKNTLNSDTDNNSILAQKMMFIDDNQEKKRFRRTIACSFNVWQGPGRRLRKERDCSQSGLKSLGS